MKVSIPDPVALHAAIEFDWTPPTDTLPGMAVQAVILYFGDTRIAKWQLTAAELELFTEQPGDYWSDEHREHVKRSFISGYVAAKLAPVFAGLDGLVGK